MRPFPIITAFSVLAVLIYGASIGNEFVTWDDPLLILNNPAIQSMNWKTLIWIFTHYDPELYIPLTYLSYQFDHLFAGLSPALYHAHNLFLHTVNALLVTWLTFLLSKRNQWIALFCGVAFLVHPLHTEAVAWASARKDVLSAAFFLGSLISYLKFEKRSERLLLVLSLVLFVLGLLSKVMIVTLPAVIVLIALYERKDLNRVFWKYLSPYIAIGIVFIIIALFGKRALLESATPFSYVLVAFNSTSFYLEKLFVPLNLSVLVPYTGPITLSNPYFYLPVVAILALATLTTLTLARTRLIAFSLLFYLLTLAPTFTNYAKAGMAYMASDRYGYIPSIGIFFLVATLLYRFKARYSAHLPVTVICCLISVVFAALSNQQSLTWKNSETLYRHTLRIYPDAHAAQNNIGKIHASRGEYDIAKEYYDAAHAIHPTAETYYNFGLMYAAQGRKDLAREHYLNALELTPTHAQTHVNLGGMLAEEGRTLEAIAHFQSAVETKPEFLIAHLNLGHLYLELDRLAEAKAAYSKVLKLNLDIPDALRGLAKILLKEGNQPGAESLLERARQLEGGL